MRPALYTHTKWLAPTRPPATPDEALMLNRLADKALATAEEFGVACDRRQAIQRARENLAFVTAMYERSAEYERI